MNEKKEGFFKTVCNSPLAFYFCLVIGIVLLGLVLGFGLTYEKTGQMEREPATYDVIFKLTYNDGTEYISTYSFCGYEQPVVQIYNTGRCDTAVLQKFGLENRRNILRVFPERKKSLSFYEITSHGEITLVDIKTTNTVRR